MEGISKKDVSQVQMVLSSRNEGAMKSSFDKLHGIFSFSFFTLGTASTPL